MTTSKALLRTAVVATALISLMNLPFAFAFDDDAGVAKPVAWMVTLLGVVGLVAAAALLRRVAWAAGAVTLVGAVNLAAAAVALAQNRQGAVIGLVVSVAVTALGVACLRTGRTVEMAS